MDVRVWLYRRLSTVELMLWTVELEKTLQSPLHCKEIRPVNPEGNQSWIFIRRTDAEAEAPILWPPDAKSQLIGKDPDAGKNWRWEERGSTEDEMVDGITESSPEQTLGVGDGQGSLECCSPCDHKDSDMTGQLNWTDWKFSLVVYNEGPQAKSSPQLLCVHAKF